MKVLLLDNYDSFTYNLAHQLRELNVTHEVRRNDQITIKEAQDFDKIILSPGPGIPKNAGILKELIRSYMDSKSMLGVCLGHQAIAEVCGGTLNLLDDVYHGVTGLVETCAEHYIFDTQPEHIQVGRYHSWTVDETTLPSSLIVTARDSEGSIMAIKHREYDVHGVQFHPESIMTPSGIELIRRFIQGNPTQSENQIKLN